MSMSHPLLTIALLPLAGFLLNGLIGGRAGRAFVSLVGCGLPIAAFALYGIQSNRLETMHYICMRFWRLSVS